MTPALAAVAKLSAIVAARMAASISFLNSISPPLRRGPAPLLTRKCTAGRGFRRSLCRGLAAEAVRRQRALSRLRRQIPVVLSFGTR